MYYVKKEDKLKLYKFEEGKHKEFAETMMQFGELEFCIGQNWEKMLKVKQKGKVFSINVNQYFLINELGTIVDMVSDRYLENEYDKVGE